MSGPVTIGCTVHYRLSAEDAEAIAFQRAELTSRPRGNTAREGDIYPATVVRVNAGSHVGSGTFAQSANLQVHLDGLDTYWATSRTEWPSDVAGQAESHTGCWFWPPRAGG